LQVTSEDSDLADVPNIDIENEDWTKSAINDPGETK
jgi:hypothetical protein